MENMEDQEYKTGVIKTGDIQDLIQVSYQSKTNMLIIGDAGTGKSTVINDMENKGCGVVTLTGSSICEDTINGIPYMDKKDGVVRYSTPEWLKELRRKEADKKNRFTILFLDEFNTAEPQVLKTFLTILTDRKVPTLPADKGALPENTVIVAAMNRAEDNDGTELITPLKSRFLTYVLEYTINDYKQYLKQYVDENQAEFNNKFSGTEAVHILSNVLNIIGHDKWLDKTSLRPLNPRSVMNTLRGYANAEKNMEEKVLEAGFGTNIKIVIDTEKELEKKKAKKANIAYIENLDELNTQEKQAYYKILIKRGKFTDIMEASRVKLSLEQSK